MQVTETSGANYIIESPRLVGDSLTGAAFRVDFVNLRTMRSEEKVVAPHQVPLATISRVAIMQTDATAVIVIVAVVAVAAIVAGVVARSDPCFPAGCR